MIKKKTKQQQQLQHVDPVYVYVLVIPEFVELISKDSDLYGYKKKKKQERPKFNNPVDICLKS